MDSTLYGVRLAMGSCWITRCPHLIDNSSFGGFVVSTVIWSGAQGMQWKLRQHGLEWNQSERDAAKQRVHYSFRE